MSARIGVYLEVGAKRVFASAADWPGWSRTDKDESKALEKLALYASRYARVVRLARIDFPSGATDFNVLERAKGSATTDFGAPGIPAKNESKPVAKKQLERLVALLDACWKYLDQVVARAPQELRKGPRGGGRDRDKMYAHVLESEWGYSRMIGVRLEAPDRTALRAGLLNASADTKWPVPYAIRRIAWHALDHAWEIEDRLP